MDDQSLSKRDARIEHDVYVTLRDHFAALRAEDHRRLDERFSALSKALELQAAEYERRLHILNGEFERDRVRQHDYVTADKYETTLEAEKIAREAALLRVDEKFDDYVKRYEIRQREVDLLLAAQSGAADEAKRAVEEQGRKSNRNLGLASLALGIIVFGANIIPVLVR